MTEIVIGDPNWAYLAALGSERTEQGAALFLRRDEAGDRYLVQEVVVASGVDCLRASSVEFCFSPAFISAMTRRARVRHQHLAMFHTHPKGCSQFSLVDDETEAGLASYFETRVPSLPAFSLMMSDGHLQARILGTDHAINVRRVGASVRDAFRLSEEVTDERYDRQVRAFGEDGQAVLGRLRVAIVGLGGTGSLVAQQLAYLGVKHLTFVDADYLERTNINRVVGATSLSTGVLKVAVAAALFSAIQPQAQVNQLAVSVMTERARVALCQSDCIFLCTDSHSSRAFVNELAYQYLVPTFDMGVSISAKEERVEAITGRVQMLAPGLPCLLCSRSIDYEAVRQELMSPADRAADPYFNGAVDIKQPAVISINSTTASLAVTMFLGAFTNIPVQPRWQSYDALRGTVRALAGQAQHDCGVCSATGMMAAGDSRALSFLPSREA